MSNELKPCPFCGGEAEMLTAESMHGGIDSPSYNYCPNCGAKVIGGDAE